MQGSTNQSVPETGRIRSISAGKLRIHNDHVSDGERKSKKCPFCVKGLQGVVAAIGPRLPVVERDGLVEGAGTDEEGTAAPAPGDGPGAQDGYTLLQFPASAELPG